MIMQVVKAAHTGRAHGYQLGLAGVGIKQIVEQAGVIQIFRNGDFQLLLLLGLFAKRQRRVDSQQQANRKARCRRDADISHAGGKPQRHGQKNTGDIARRTRRRAEAHQTERARHRHARAQITVHQQNNGLHQDRQQRQRDGHGLCIGIFEHIHGGDQRAEKQRHRHTNKKALRRDARREYRTKQSVKHRKHPVSLRTGRAAWSDRRCRIWKSCKKKCLLRKARAPATAAWLRVF